QPGDLKSDSFDGRLIFGATVGAEGKTVFWKTHLTGDLSADNFYGPCVSESRVNCQTVFSWSIVKTIRQNDWTCSSVKISGFMFEAPGPCSPSEMRQTGSDPTEGCGPRRQGLPLLIRQSALTRDGRRGLVRMGVSGRMSGKCDLLKEDLLADDMHQNEC
ncbi:hypothetical protein BaRGS_00000096, partial [Batillaria attramentaria]